MTSIAVPGRLALLLYSWAETDGDGREHLTASPVSLFARPVTEVRPVRNFLADEFSCPQCSSQSVVYPTTPKEDAYVTCRGCGVVIATLAQFRRLVKPRLLSTRTPLSGC